MANDMSSAVDMLQELLSSPDAGEKISSMLSAFTGDSQNDTAVPDLSGIMSMFGKGNSGEGSDDTASALKDLPVANIMNIATAYKQLSSSSDPRTTLLQSMRPYLQPHRHQNVDQAIKILGFLKLMPLLGEFKGLL